MDALEMEIALMRWLDIRRNIVVPNVYWGMGLHYECDIVKVTQSGYGTEIEIKVSKQDLKRDKKKIRAHTSNLFRYFYFAVPAELKDFALKEIPERAGLIVVGRQWLGIRDGWTWVVKIVKKARVNPRSRKWTDAEIFKLARLGTMRILPLKEANFFLTNKEEEA